MAGDEKGKDRSRVGKKKGKKETERQPPLGKDGQEKSEKHGH